MSSLLNHGLVRTAAVEQVVAPIASHICHLVLICDSVEEPEHFSRLEAAARAVAKATDNLADVASRRMKEAEDEELQVEMSSLLESVSASGQHVLLAAQKLGIQPGLTEHREELVTATQNVFLEVVKVLLVDDGAAVRRVTAAADGVLECLAQLGSSSDIESLLGSFQVFSRSLLLLHHLTMERANSLKDPGQTEQLLDDLETLRRCISMLHTAMCTSIRHPSSEQAQAAKRYVLDKVQGAVSDIITTLKSECHSGSVGGCGFYTWKRNSLLHLLTGSPATSIQDGGFDSLVRDLVFHCMVVANSSCPDSQQRLVAHCRHILQFWSDMKRVLKSSEDPDVSEQSLEKTCSLLVQQIQTLDQTLTAALLHQVLDTFVAASSTAEELFSVTRKIQSSTEMDLNTLQPAVEDFISSTDRIIRVSDLISAVSVDAEGLENVASSKACLARLRAQIAPCSLELVDNSPQTAQKLLDLYQKWEEVTGQLLEALGDVLDVREFTSAALDHMDHERRGCDAAASEQSCERLNLHATNLMRLMKLVIGSVRRHVDQSDNPIYRNGLLVLLKQVQSSQSRVAGSLREMPSGSSLNVEGCATFSRDLSTAVEHFKVLRQGLDGQQHPHLLSPLRDGARRPETSESLFPAKDRRDADIDHVRAGSDVSESLKRDSQTEPEEEPSDEEPTGAELAHKYDLKISAASIEPRRTLEPPEFDLLPLLYEVVTVTKRKDVTALNRSCTGVLELSNCYVQAAKEAMAVVDAPDYQTLESFRAELVSLTPLLIQTAQETAMSSAASAEKVYKHGTRLSDLINHTRRVLAPAAGAWHHAVYNQLRGKQPTMAASVEKQLKEVMTLCADMIQFLTSSDLGSQGESQEEFSSLHNKLRKAQNHTRQLVEKCSTPVVPVVPADQLEGLCILWGLSIRILLNSVDKVLGTSTAANHWSPQRLLSALSENSLRIQEAARLTGLSSKSAFRSKQFSGFQEELKNLTQAHLKAAEDLDLTPNVIQLAKSEFSQRHIFIKIRVLLGLLSKANKDYHTALQNLVRCAASAAAAAAAAGPSGENKAEDAEQIFETAAQSLFENVKLATKKVEDSLNYIRDPRTRSDLRSVNDHLSFQISDIVSKARLAPETRYVCDALSLDVQLQCWSAKAHYVVEEIRKHEGIHQEAKEHIRALLQGGTTEDMKEALATIPPKVREVEFPSEAKSWQRGHTEAAHVAEPHVSVTAEGRSGPRNIRENDAAESGFYKGASSPTYTSLYLRRESQSWDPGDNRIVQVTRKMADIIFYMTQYLKRKGPIPNKEGFVAAAKDVISNCQSVTQFIRVIANNCLDKECTAELSLIVQQILTMTNQLSIISSVNAVTPGCKSSDEILVKNAQNLLQTVLRGVRAAEVACMTGLKQLEPDSDGAEATALCFQWRRKLEIHRARQTANPDTDELGLRKTSSHPVAPSLVPPVNVNASPAKHKQQ